MAKIVEIIKKIVRKAPTIVLNGPVWLLRFVHNNFGMKAVKRIFNKLFYWVIYYVKNHGEKVLTDFFEIVYSRNIIKKWLLVIVILIILIVLIIIAWKIFVWYFKLWSLGNKEIRTLVDIWNMFGGLRKPQQEGAKEKVREDAMRSWKLFYYQNFNKKNPRSTWKEHAKPPHVKSRLEAVLIDQTWKKTDARLKKEGRIIPKVILLPDDIDVLQKHKIVQHYMRSNIGEEDNKQDQEQMPLEAEGMKKEIKGFSWWNVFIKHLNMIINKEREEVQVQKKLSEKGDMEIVENVVNAANVENVDNSAKQVEAAEMWRESEREQERDTFFADITVMHSREADVLRNNIKELRKFAETRERIRVEKKVQEKLLNSRILCDVSGIAESQRMWYEDPEHQELVVRRQQLNVEARMWQRIRLARKHNITPDQVQEIHILQDYNRNDWFDPERMLEERQKNIVSSLKDVRARVEQENLTRGNQFFKRQLFETLSIYDGNKEYLRRRLNKLEKERSEVLYKTVPVAKKMNEDISKFQSAIRWCGGSPACRELEDEAIEVMASVLGEEKGQLRGPMHDYVYDGSADMQTELHRLHSVLKVDQLPNRRLVVNRQDPRWEGLAEVRKQELLSYMKTPEFGNATVAEVRAAYTEEFMSTEVPEANTMVSIATQVLEANTRESRAAEVPEANTEESRATEVPEANTVETRSTEVPKAIVDEIGDTELGRILGGK
jgi:hypothetical protein